MAKDKDPTSVPGGSAEQGPANPPTTPVTDPGQVETAKEFAAEIAQTAEDAAKAKVDTANQVAAEKIDVANSVAGAIIDAAKEVANTTIEAASGAGGPSGPLPAGPGGDAGGGTPGPGSPPATGGAGGGPSGPGGRGPGGTVGGDGGGSGPAPTGPRPTLREVVSSRFTSLVSAILSLPALMGFFIFLAMVFIFNTASDPSRILDVGYARGLITLLFSVGTIVIAVILTFSAVFQAVDQQSPEVVEKRFARGKEILSLLIGIFGTILGFYFGSLKDDPQNRPTIEAIEAAGGNIKAGVIYLDNPNVTDATLVHLRRLPTVERLYLDRSKITDDGLIYLYDLANLSFLSLNGTKVSKAAADQLREAIGKDWKQQYKLTIRYPSTAAGDGQGVASSAEQKSESR